MQNNIITDKEYNQFMDDIWNIVETNEDFNKLFSDVKKRNKFKQFKFFTQLFEHWRKGDVEWYLNNEVMKNANK